MDENEQSIEQRRVKALESIASTARWIAVVLLFILLVLLFK
jgi:hypothetical protein